MRAPLKALDPLDQFESSTAHSAAIMAFELAALPSLSAGDASLHGDNDVVKYTIVTAISMATTCRSYRLATILDIRGFETTVVILHGRRAGRRR